MRGGDLLWLLSPAPPPAQPQDAATAPAAAAAEAGAKRARDANDPPAGNTQQQQQQQQQVQPAADKGKQAATAAAGEGQDDGAEAMAVEQEGEADPQPELEPLPPSQRLPAYLLRTLQASWAPSSGPSDVLLLAAHAAMLETGFVPHWPAGSASSSSGDSAFGLPRSCWASSSVCRIHYTLQPGNGDDSSSSATAEAEEGAAEPGEGAAEQQAAAGPACTLQCSSMGGGAVVLAVSTQRHARHLALRAATFVQPLESAAAGGGAAVPHSSDGAGPSSAAAAEAAEGPSSAVQLLPDGGLALGGHLHLGAAAAKQLWTRLKDGLAFPMLLAAYAEAGLAPPAGLLALPEDLKQRVLEGLGVSVAGRAGGRAAAAAVWGGEGSESRGGEWMGPAAPALCCLGSARCFWLHLPDNQHQGASLPLPPLQPHDLATLCCACRELRHLASQDALWCPLFDKDFPRATQWYTDQVRLCSRVGVRDGSGRLCHRAGDAHVAKLTMQQWCSGAQAPF